MDTAILTTSLGVLGILGTAVLVILAVRVMWFYRGSRQWSFRWHLRNWRMLQLSAIACFFFLAMAASYGVLGEDLGLGLPVGRTKNWHLVATLCH